MVKHCVFGYKVNYEWIKKRARELEYEVPDDTDIDEGLNLMETVLTTLAVRAGLWRSVFPIPVKGRSNDFALCLASSDPKDGLPSGETDNEKIEKLKMLVGADGPPSWFWRY